MLRDVKMAEKCSHWKPDGAIHMLVDTELYRLVWGGDLDTE